MKNNKAVITGIVVIILIIGGIALAMNGGSDNKSSTPAATPATSSSPNQKTASNSDAMATMDVSIENYMFSPMSIKVKVGDTVTWTNKDSVHHNVIADTASADAPNGPLIGKGETYKFTFKKAGTYTFHCAPHPYMHGTVVVTE